MRTDAANPLLAAPETEALVPESLPAEIAVAPDAASPEMDAEQPVVLMGTREFREFTEEVLVHVSLALDLTGLDGQYEAVVLQRTEEEDEVFIDTFNPARESYESVIQFQDEHENALSVYVSVGADGLIWIGVMKEDESVLPVSAFAMDEIDELVEDLAMTIEREIPRATFH